MIRQANIYWDWKGGALRNRIICGKLFHDAILDIYKIERFDQQTRVRPYLSEVVFQFTLLYTQTEKQNDHSDSKLQKISEG